MKTIDTTMLIRYDSEEWEALKYYFYDEDVRRYINDIGLDLTVDRKNRTIKINNLDPFVYRQGLRLITNDK